MGCVADILATKGSQVHSVTPQSTVSDAITLMMSVNVGSLLVMENEQPIGIFTERDCLRRVLLERRDPKTTSIGELMSERIIYVAADKSIKECMAIMTQERIRHLPVMDGDCVVGLISIGDLVKHLSREQEAEIQHLTRYITGVA